jgi:hypothetical protein
VTAAVLLTAMISGPIGARLAPYHLAYSVRLHDGFLITAAYFIAVCGPLLLSGYRHVTIFGIVNLVAVVIIARLTASGFASVCAGGLRCPAAPSRCTAATPDPIASIFALAPAGSCARAERSGEPASPDSRPSQGH